MNSTLDFPKDSIKRAQEIAEIYHRREKSKANLAANLYDGHFFEIVYGFDEAIKRGKCGLYLHEIEKKADCFTLAAANYLIARELELDPRFYWASDMKDLESGERAHEEASADHTFITVNAGRDKTIIIDPFQGKYGDVTFKKDQNGMTIYNRSQRKETLREYSALLEFSQERIIEKIEQNRSPGGGRVALSGTQKVSSRGEGLYITFDQSKSMLLLRIQFGDNLPDDEPYKKSEIYRLETKVNQDGSFNLDEGTFVSYYAGPGGWSGHLDEQEPFRFPTREAQIASDLINAVLLKNEKIKKANSSGTRRLKVDLNRLGLNYGFSTVRGSAAKNIIENEFADEIGSLRSHQDNSVSDFLERAREHEITWRTFLREAQYRTARDKRISNKNEFGYVFSTENHNKLLEAQFEAYASRLYSYDDHLVKTIRINAGLDPGSNRLADRKRETENTRFRKDLRFFQCVLDSRKVRNEPYAYPMLADRTLFFEQFDVANDPISKLEKGLTVKDLRLAGKDRLFEVLLLFASRGDSLYARQYHKGLKRILDQTT